MDRSTLLVGAAIGLGIAAWMLSRPAQVSTVEGRTLYARWTSLSDGLPATQWDAEFAAAEGLHGMPVGLLRRVAWTESRFDPQAISPAGAIGLMQIIPRWHPGVDPWDPVGSIHYAAQYLADLERQFRSWPLALAAYNWGPGNLSRYGIESAPAETRQYVASIRAGMGWT